MSLDHWAPLCNWVQLQKLCECQRTRFALQLLLLCHGMVYCNTIGRAREVRVSCPRAEAAREAYKPALGLHRSGTEWFDLEHRSTERP